MATKFCIDCQRNVTPRRKFSWAKFFLLLGFFYLPFYLLQKKRCPICNGTHFEHRH